MTKHFSMVGLMTQQPNNSEVFKLENSNLSIIPMGYIIYSIINKTQIFFSLPLGIINSRNRKFFPAKKNPSHPKKSYQLLLLLFFGCWQQQSMCEEDAFILPIANTPTFFYSTFLGISVCS
jgi:hypothetical protein